MNLFLLFGVVVANVTSWLPDNITQFWVEPDRPAMFTFTAQADPNAENKQDVKDEVQFTVKTTDGVQFTTGVAKLDGDKLSVETTLPQGYFELELPATEQTFGVASQPAFIPNDALLASDAKGRTDLRQRDDFFGIDSASTWLVSDDKAREELIANAKRMGIATYRERVSWRRLEPKEGQFEYNGDNNAEKVRLAAQKYDMPILELFHNATDWTGTIGAYPADLLKTATSWGEVASRWNKSWNSFEVWNEPDISFSGNIPADQYVPVLKSVAQELKRKNIQTPIVGGIIASFNDPFMDLMAENGGIDACDIFSFHTYCRAFEMEDVSMRYLNWLRKYKSLGKPVWITECGRPWKKGTNRPNGEADLESAIDIVQKGVAARALGIDAYFPFVYVYYEENDNNFGMSDRNNAPLRSAAGYARCIYLLSGKSCLGSLAIDGVERSYVFGDAEEQIAVLYVRSRQPGRKIVLPGVPLYVERVTGERLSLDENNAVDFSDGMLYVAYSTPYNVLVTTEPTRVDLMREQRAYDREQSGVVPRCNSDVVARFDFDPNVVEANSGGYMLKDSDATTLTGKISVYNFSDVEKTLPVTGTIMILRSWYERLPNDISYPNQIVVPSRGKVELEFTVSLEGATPFNHPKLTFTFGEDCVLSLPLSRRATEANFKSMVEATAAVPFNDVTRWFKNSSSCKKLEFLQECMDQGNWGFEIDFNEGDRWAYPIFVIPQEQGEDGKVYLIDGDRKFDMSQFKGVAFKYTATSSSPEGVVRVFTYTGDRQGYYFSASGIGKTDGEEHFVIVPFDSLSLSGNAGNGFDPKFITGISVGANSRGDEMRIEVKDFLFFK